MNKFLLEISIKSALYTLLSLALLLTWPNLNLISTKATETNTATPSAEKETKPVRSWKVDPTGTFIEDELIVKFKKELPLTAKKGILSLHKSTIIRESSRLEAVLIQINSSKRGQITKAIEANPSVKYVSLNHIGEVQEGTGGGGGGSSHTPNDFYYAGFQWATFYIIQAQVGWLFNKGSSSTRVAVLDTGVDYNHYDLGLSPSGKVIKGFDFVDNDTDPDDEDFGRGHGTSVAGIIGAKTNNVSGIAGVNWYTKIIAIRVVTSNGLTTAFDIADGIFDAVDRGAHVINISLVVDNDSPTLKNAVNVALSNGVIVVASVKNSTTTNCFMGFPAAYSGVISVGQLEPGALGCRGNIKSGITYQGIRITAPGKNIFTLRKGSDIGYESGTSVAAPLVSGVVSILRNCTTSTNAKWDTLLGSTDTGSPGYDSIYGYGYVSLYSALLRTCY